MRRCLGPCILVAAKGDARPERVACQTAQLSTCHPTQRHTRCPGGPPPSPKPELLTSVARCESGAPATTCLSKCPGKCGPACRCCEGKARRQIKPQPPCAHPYPACSLGMVNLGQEANLRGRHWVVLRQEKLQLKHATLIGGLLRPQNHHIEVAQVLLRGRSANAGRCEHKAAWNDPSSYATFPPLPSQHTRLAEKFLSLLYSRKESKESVRTAPSCGSQWKARAERPTLIILRGSCAACAA